MFWVFLKKLKNKYEEKRELFCRYYLYNYKEKHIGTIL